MEPAHELQRQLRKRSLTTEGLAVLGSAFLLALAVVCGLVMFPA